MDKLLMEPVSAWSSSDVARLFAATEKHPVVAALGDRIGADWLVRTWSRLQESDGFVDLFVSMTPRFLWTSVLPLAGVITIQRLSIVGIAGPPGVGKTTLAGALRHVLSSVVSNSNAVSLSLDDFGLSKEARKAKGIEFRAAPGAHDDAKIERFVADLRAGRTLEVPRFDSGLDAPVESVRMSSPVTHVVVEGWFLGARIPGYEPLADTLDYLIYLDCADNFSRDRRFTRESELRLKSSGRLGYSEAEMEEFWAQVLAPGIAQFVRPVRGLADLVLALDDDGGVTQCIPRAGRL